MLDERPLYVLARIQDPSKQRFLRALSAVTTGPERLTVPPVAAAALTVALMVIWVMGG